MFSLKIQVLDPSLQGHWGVLEHVQRRAMEMVKDLEHISPKEQLWEPGLAWREKEASGVTLIAHFICL